MCGLSGLAVKASLCEPVGQEALGELCLCLLGILRQCQGEQYTLRTRSETEHREGLTDAVSTSALWSPRLCANFGTHLGDCLMRATVTIQRLTSYADWILHSLLAYKLFQPVYSTLFRYTNKTQLPLVSHHLSCFASMSLLLSPDFELPRLVVRHCVRLKVPHYLDRAPAW